MHSPHFLSFASMYTRSTGDLLAYAVHAWSPALESRQKKLLLVLLIKGYQWELDELERHLSMKLPQKRKFWFREIFME